MEEEDTSAHYASCLYILTAAGLVSHLSGRIQCLFSRRGGRRGESQSPGKEEGGGCLPGSLPATRLCLSLLPHSPLTSSCLPPGLSASLPGGGSPDTARRMHCLIPLCSCLLHSLPLTQQASLRAEREEIPPISHQSPLMRRRRETMEESGGRLSEESCLSSICL